jgi:hypothetical protein
MSSEATRLVIAIFDQGVEADVMEALDALGLRHFTKISNVAGRGETGPREGTPIWPGLNTVLLLVMPAERVQPLVDRLHAIRDSFPITPGMKFIVVPAEML